MVRRTLYGHFPKRQALIEALAADAKEALPEAAATAVLIAAGIDPASARVRVRVRAILGEVAERGPGADPG